MSLVPNEGQKSMFPMIDKLRKEVERLQKENDELRQQLKKCNLQNVSNCALPPLAEFATEPCPNCKETVEQCACMRNICHKCGKPVGNITFTICDECWDIEFPPKS